MFKNHSNFVNSTSCINLLIYYPNLIFLTVLLGGWWTWSSVWRMMMDGLIVSKYYYLFSLQFISRFLLLLWWMTQGYYRNFYRSYVWNLFLDASGDILLYALCSIAGWSHPTYSIIFLDARLITSIIFLDASGDILLYLSGSVAGWSYPVWF